MIKSEVKIGIEVKSRLSKSDPRYERKNGLIGKVIKSYSNGMFLIDLEKSMLADNIIDAQIFLEAKDFNPIIKVSKENELMKFLCR